MSAHVADPRHRFSYELRPDAQLESVLRGLARRLEDDQLLPAGASTAPRFQPHLTLLRADHADRELVDALAGRVPSSLALATAGGFGDGRIAWLAPDGGEQLASARTWLVKQLGADHVDPLALARDPWVPHVTVAYAVEQQHRDAVRAALAAVLPLGGSWATVEAWDLDVRPTVRVAQAIVSRTSAP